MRWTCVTIISCLISATLTAQQDFEPRPEDLQLITRKLDSLTVLIKQGRAKIFTTGCVFPGHKEQYFINDLSFVISGEAMKLTENTRGPYLHVITLLYVANRNYENKNYAGAIVCWKKALGISKAYGFTYEELHHCRVALNNSSFLSGNYAEAMQNSSEGLTRAEEIGDKTQMAHFSNVIGYIHMKQKNFAEAERYFIDYLNLSRHTRDSVWESHALYNLADLYLTRGLPDTALNYLERSLKIYRIIALNPERRFALPEREGYISNKMAHAWMLKKEYETALRFIRVSLVSAEEAVGVNSYDKAEYYIRAAEIFNQIKKPDSALLLSHKGLAISKHIIHREHMMYACQQLSEAFAQVKQFDSAWYYQSKFQRLSDTITNESSQRDILLRETYLSIEREKVKQQAALENQRIWRNIFIGLALVTMIISYLIYNRYRLRQKNRMQAELNKQQLEILRTTIEVQDKERKRIAEDLHDSLGSILSAAKLKLSAIEIQGSQNGNGENAYVDDTLSLMDEAINEMKNIAYNIMPATLSRLGLIVALQNLFNRISHRSRLNINFSTYGFEERLDAMLEMSIYRIVLESINNVVKHAHANHVTVQLIKYPDYINITIEDDGLGFRQTLEFLGNGLANIDSRVRNLGGSLDIDSVEGRGTTILVDIPFRKG